MRTELANKMSGSGDCQCAHCRTVRAGVQPGYPLSPADYMKVNPPRTTDRWAVIEEDPAVRRAAKAVKAAQDAYDAVETRWYEAVRAAQSEAIQAASVPTVIAADGGPSEREARRVATRRARARELEDRVAALSAERARKWVPLAAARNEHSIAWQAARARFEESNG